MGICLKGGEVNMRSNPINANETIFGTDLHHDIASSKIILSAKFHQRVDPIASKA